MGIKKDHGGEDYKNTIQKAYYTYRSTDDEFDRQVKEMLALHGELQQKVYSPVKVPELERDPFELTMEEFEALYDNIARNYTNTMPTGLNLASLIPGLAGEEEEVDGAVGEEKKEGVAEVITVPQSYSSMDRQIKGEQKREEKKTLGTAEKVESVEMPASQIEPEKVEHLKPIDGEVPAVPKTEEIAKVVESPIEKAIECIMYISESFSKA